ncbi:PQQ-binding-like beta-propeller repeat protein [Derxia gummosa]|uniref:PQQ-binding-like beta-propeller repeat protein n=1 Tax=Derxia gummosa DSM 723 TaxID=1121388 RepID=A0A8B6X9Z6_9BURK|nr:PQQ-binding-like beta-propeller repeat protein [Derxia gummosa]
MSRTPLRQDAPAWPRALALVPLLTALLLAAPAHADGVPDPGAPHAVSPAPAGTPTGDAGAGKTVFDNQCAACHTATPGRNGFGPSLAGVVGRRAGSLRGYHYTDAMAHSGITWTAPEIESFLASSTAKVPGTAMAVSLSDPKARADVVAWLATLSGPANDAQAAAPAPAPTPVRGGPTQAELLGAARDRASWLYASKDWSGQRYVDLAQITPANANRLRAECIFRTDRSGATQSNPLVYDGVLYFTSEELTFAIDAATCRPRWTHRWDIKDGALSRTNRGVAIKDGRLVRGTPDGWLIELNMADGSLIWQRKIADAKSSQYLSMPPLIYENLIIVGPAGADWGAKNWVGAFDLVTGAPVWRFNVIPDDGEPGADSWPSAEARAHGGGSLWTPFTLDAERGVLWVPVGNPAPDFYRDVREGANLYTNAALALDVRSGRLLWHRQFGPADDHDRDLSQTSPLFSAGGRRLIAIGGKDGLLRVIDRDSHAQLFETAITSREGFDAQPTPEGVHSCPGLLGGLEWNGPAYSPRAHALYVSSIDWCGTFTRAAQPPAFVANAHYYGGAVAPDPADRRKGWIQALDATTGKPRWKREWPTPLTAGIVATAGGVLFTGDLDNNFLALDAATGRTLYRFNTGGSVGGGVVSYEIGGHQYVATTSGVVSGFFGGTGTSAIVVFGLP